MRRRFQRAETGAMAIFIALTTCFVVIPLGALAVDLGTQRVSRVDAQAVADTTALDMARLLVASGPSAITNAAATTDANKTSGAVGNGLTAKAYTGTLSSTFVSDQSLGCNGTTSNTYFTATTTSPTAVLVVVSNSVNFAIHGGSGGVCRSAIANAYQQACVMMDSYAAAINTGDSVILGQLNKLLGTNIQSSVLSSSGILTSSINVLSYLNVLKTQLGVASPDQVLTANVTAAQAITAGVTALTNSGNVLAANALQGIGAQINGTSTFTVGSLLGISQGSGSALGATLNPFDLAMAAAQVANGSNSLAFTASSSVVTGLSNVSVAVGSRPQLVCLGQGTKTMGQTTITATANANAPGTLTAALTNLVNGLTGVINGVLSLVTGLLGGDTYGNIPGVAVGQITANVQVASASGKVNSLTCSGAVPTTMSVQESSALAPATLTVEIDISDTHTYGSILNRQTESATAKYLLTVSTQPGTNPSVAANFNLPGDYEVPKAGPSNNLSVPYLNVGLTMTDPGTFAHSNPVNPSFNTVNGVLGNTVSNLANLVNQLNSNLLQPLGGNVLLPLANSLTSALQTAVGTTIAGSTYTAKRTASCNTPKLAG